MIGLSTVFLSDPRGAHDRYRVARTGQCSLRNGEFYEIGVLSPLLRVFFPDNQQVEAMEAELRAALIYGFFPTVWAAALSISALSAQSFTF